MTFDEFYFVALNYSRENPEQRQGQAFLNVLRLKEYAGRKDLYNLYYDHIIWNGEDIRDAALEDAYFVEMLEFVERHWDENF